MKRRLIIGAVALLGLVGLVAGAGAVMKPPPVTAEAIRSSVVRTEALMERAWALPVAATFKRTLDSQTKWIVLRPVEHREYLSLAR